MKQIASQPAISVIMTRKSRLNLEYVNYVSVTVRYTMNVNIKFFHINSPTVSKLNSKCKKSGKSTFTLCHTVSL